MFFSDEGVLDYVTFLAHQNTPAASPAFPPPMNRANSSISYANFLGSLQGKEGGGC